MGALTVCQKSAGAVVTVPNLSVSRAQPQWIKQKGVRGYPSPVPPQRLLTPSQPPPPLLGSQVTALSCMTAQSSSQITPCLLLWLDSVYFLFRVSSWPRPTRPCRHLDHCNSLVKNDLCVGHENKPQTSTKWQALILLYKWYSWLVKRVKLNCSYNFLEGLYRKKRNLGMDILRGILNVKHELLYVPTTQLMSTPNT